VPASTGTVTLTVNAAPANPGTIPLAVTVPATGAFTLTVDTTDAITLMIGNGSGHRDRRVHLGQPAGMDPDQQ